MKRSTITIGVLVLFLLAGCGLDGAKNVGSLQPREDLARKAVLAAVTRVPGAAASGGKDAGTAATDADAADGSGDELARVDDPAEDQDGGPVYADLCRVTFTDSDDGLTVSVAVDAVVPARLSRGDIENVGVDLYRTSPLDVLLGRTDSDYEVRLDGGAYGWRAFFRTRDRYVAFPGTFTLRDRTLTVFLPWEAIGGRKPADAEAFVDWSAGVGRLSTDGSSRVRLAP